jgi:hypothetical protein
MTSTSLALLAAPEHRHGPIVVNRAARVPDDDRAPTAAPLLGETREIAETILGMTLWA